MNCVSCSAKKCFINKSCNLEGFDAEVLKSDYKDPVNQKILQAAALLVDNGRAGSMSRLEEIAEFISVMDYKKPGLAYCYGMTNEAKLVKQFFKSKGIPLRTVSCTVGGIAQDEINETSCIHKVSCNPLGQAMQLNAEAVDFVIIMGICLGHDIILQKNLKADFSTFVVKDRVYSHNPLMALVNKF
jgi:uncharacterized metal-binding protein